MKKFTIATLILSVLYLPLATGFTTETSFKRSFVRHAEERTVAIFVPVEGGTILGAGVIIREDGLTLTAAHLFNHGEPVTRINMLRFDGRAYPMQLVLIDSRRDLALIRPLSRGLHFPFAPVQADDTAWVGQDVLIVGHPYEAFWSAFAGVVSRISANDLFFCHFLELQAPIGPGNSGGPVFNERGEVIGIVSAVRVDVMRTPIGIGLAISVYELRRFLAEYNEGTDTRPRRLQLQDIR